MLVRRLLQMLGLGTDIGRVAELRRGAVAHCAWRLLLLLLPRRCWRAPGSRWDRVRERRGGLLLLACGCIATVSLGQEG